LLLDCNFLLLRCFVLVSTIIDILCTAWHLVESILLLLLVHIVMESRYESVMIDKSFPLFFVDILQALSKSWIILVQTTFLRLILMRLINTL
jgi:hypothetical protein